MIKVENMSKEYIIWKREKGFWGHVKSLLIQEYQTVLAVKDISFSIEKGEIVGFIGPNGAGKSTTIKTLTGILAPTCGTVSINGFDPFRQRKQYVKKIGAVFGQRTQLWWDLPVIDSYDMLKHIYQIPDVVYHKNLKLFYEILEIEPFVTKPVRQLSLGQRMRADIAAALLHDPEIIFFDEPTIGLDITAKQSIRNFIRYTNETKNVTMIFTTHDMQDIAEICSRVIIIDKGGLIYDDALTNLKSFGGFNRTLRLVLEDAPNMAGINLGAAKIELLGEKEINLSFQAKEMDIEKLIHCIAEKNRVEDIIIEEMNIETIVKNIYAENTEENRK